MKEPLPARVRFGAFELDLKAGELRPADVADEAEGGRRVLLPEQPFRLLLLLVEREGNIATREEIQKKLWPNDTLVEFEHSIHAAINKLRKALGDSADEPQYIETIPRRGYRLMVPVEWIAGVDVSPAVASAQIAGGAGAAVRMQPDPGALTGRTVSHYRVMDIIGGGGMGVVYRAEDLKLGRRVALKFLSEEMGSDPQALERFEREARAASSLDHPNICSIFEFGEHEGRTFMVMQLLEGQTLRERLAACEGTLPLEELLGIGIQVSDGLQAAHERGIIHRDIKPATIFLTTKGVCKILDFGLAKLLEVGNEDEASPQPNATVVALPAASGSSHLTQAGGATGTEGYMSPEQLRREILDAGTDLFSFGLVLYEMATGRRAFSGDTLDELHEAILHQTPIRVQEVWTDLPHRLEQIINRALEKVREQRYQNAAELRAELMELQRSFGSASAEQQEVDRGTPIVEAQAVERQTRVLEAAAPKEAIVGVSIEVVAMVRREESGGLRAHLKIEGPLGPTPEDVRDRAFDLEFAVDANGITQPADITLRLESPNFEPRTQTKRLRVSVRADSAPCTFLITPQVAGELIANLELLNAEEQVVVSRALRMRALAGGPAIGSPMVVVTIPLVLVVHDAGASIDKFPTGAGKGNISKEGEKITTVAVASDTTEAAMDITEIPSGDLFAGPFVWPAPGGPTRKEFAHYRVLKIIGESGMDMVYEAEDLELGRRVALKFLAAITRQHFERARTVLSSLSSLNHPHIYPVYEFGEYQRQAFLVMELLEGGPYVIA